MAVSGNKMAPSVGGGSGWTKEDLASPEYKNIHREREEAVAKKQLQVKYGAATGKHTKSYDIMTPGMRKQADKVSKVVNQASYLTDNVNTVLKKVSGNHLALPK